LIFNFFRIKKR